MAEHPKRLLLDENLSARVAGALHVGNVGLLGAPDSLIWQHARENSLVIVSKDDDFHRLSIFHGSPPKVIWIGLGNCSTEDVIRLLRDRRAAVEEFLAHEEAAFLALAR